MSIFLYQIGMDRITALGTDFAGLQIDLPRTFKASVSQSFSNPQVVFGGLRSYPEPQEVSVTGTFLCSGCESVSDQFNRLLSMAGKPYIDIIGYLPNDCCCIGESCGKCGNCQGDKPVTWMTTTGIITDVDRHYEIVPNSPYPGKVMEVSFKMVLDVFWYPMNPYIWFSRHDTEPYDSFRVDTQLVKAILPVNVDSDANFSFWKRNYEDDYALYNADLWEDMYAPDNAMGRSRIISDGTPHVYRLRVPRTRWAASPLSTYSFANYPFFLPLGGIPSITITVQSELAPFQTRTFVSHTIDVLSGAELIVTDGLYRPGFKRDASGNPIMISNFLSDTPFTQIPEWTYETFVPGEVIGLDNIITIEAPAGTEISYLHTFRGL